MNTPTPRTDERKASFALDTIRQLEIELTAARQEIDMLKSKYADHHAEAERLTSEINAVTKQRDVASQCHKWCYEDRKRITEELTSVTDQRDELLRYNEEFRNETLICADCDAIRKEEYDQAIEQRDRLEDQLDDAIAMIRMNVIARTFEECTIKQIDKHLKPWIDEIAAVKGGSDDPVNLIHNGVGIADMYQPGELEKELRSMTGAEPQNA